MLLLESSTRVSQSLGTVIAKLQLHSKVQHCLHKYNLLPDKPRPKDNLGSAHKTAGPSS